MTRKLAASPVLVLRRPSLRHEPVEIWNHHRQVFIANEGRFLAWMTGAGEAHTRTACAIFEFLGLGMHRNVVQFWNRSVLAGRASAARLATSGQT